MAMPAAVYGIIAPFIALAFVVSVRRLDPAYRELAGSPAAEIT
jgi:BASS family bile acid:Na+ symporter